MPPADMSRTRSWTSKQPGRISVYMDGLTLYISRGLPATALRPRLRPFFSPYHHCWKPWASVSIRGVSSRYLAETWPSNMSAGSAM